MRAARDTAAARPALPDDAPQPLRSAFAHELHLAEKDPQAWVRLGALCEANLYWEQAAECFTRAASAQPNDPLLALHAALARSQVDASSLANAWLVEQCERYSRSAPWRQFAADLLFERGELQSAAHLYAQARELAPERPEPCMGLAECALEHDTPEIAVALLEQAVALDPMCRAAHFLLGRAYRAVGRREDAEREFALGAGGARRRMPDRLSKNVDALVLDFERVLGLAAKWIASGRAAAAEELLQRHAERNAHDPRLAVNLGLARMAQTDHEGALRWFDAAVELDGDAFQAHANRSACLLKLGRLEAARLAAERAVECAPASHRTHLALARALAALDRHAEAAAAAARSVELEPRDAASRQTLGEALLILGGVDELALEQFVAQRDLLPHSWTTHAELARALAVTGREAEARAALASARALGADPDVITRLARQLGIE